MVRIAAEVMDVDLQSAYETDGDPQQTSLRTSPIRTSNSQTPGMRGSIEVHSSRHPPQHRQCKALFLLENDVLVWTLGRTRDSEPRRLTRQR
jgi:hypothetical protein